MKKRNTLINGLVLLMRITTFAGYKSTPTHETLMTVSRHKGG